MLQYFLSIVAQLMIGRLGKEAVSAVGLCGYFSLIYSVVMGAVGSVAGILILQFLGAKDDKEAWRSFFVVCVYTSLTNYPLNVILTSE